MERVKAAGICILLVFLLVVGIWFSSLLGGGTGSSDTSDTSSELSSEEMGYLDQRADIAYESIAIANDQLEIHNACPDYCASLQDDAQQNADEMSDLYDEAQYLNPPNGYGETHDLYLMQMDLLLEQVDLVVFGGIVSGNELDYLVEQANEYLDESLNSLHPTAREYYNNIPETSET